MYCSRCGHELSEGARFCPSCGLDLAATTPVTRVSAEPVGDKSERDLVKEALAAEYDVLEELGRGGMAIVYRARERQLEREVALKVLPFSLAFDAEFVERFQREARTAARLEHPSIIPIYRVGRSGRVIYFVMKMLRGQALSRIISARGAITPMEIKHLLVSTAGALGFAHRHGIVHRDIKPDNIMFDELGHPVLTDFGIAKAASGTRLTGTGMSIGTPHYMSPEQARAQPLDGRSDLYSLGVVAYQCLTGRVPFDGDDAFAIGYKHIMEPLAEPPLETAEARKLFAVIRRMLEKRPEDRFQSAEDLVRELEGRRASVTMLEMDPGAGATLALTPEEAERIRGTAPRSSAAVPPPPPPPPAPTTPMAPPPVSDAPPTEPRAPRPPTAAEAPRAGAVAEEPPTPVTPMPRRPAVRPPRSARRRSGGVGIAASIVLAVGAGGAGGYYLYTQVLNAPPPPAVEEPARGPVELAVVTQPPVDAALIAARDSAARAEAERFAALPDSGWLIVRGVPAGGRLFIEDRAFRGDTMVQVGVGTQKVRVSATGYDNFDGSVAVGKGDTVPYTVAMTRTQRQQAAPAAQPQPAAPPAAADAPAGQCSNPRESTYNQDFLCWDTQPRLQGPAFVTVDAGSVASTRPVEVLVQVGADGGVLQAFPVPGRNVDPGFLQIAVRFARQQRYTPATKNGRPVESWFRFRFAPQVRQ